MVFKVNISEKTGKTFHLDLGGEELVGKELHDKIEGNLLSPDLSGYEFEITGASDEAGFPSLEIIPGIGLKKVLLSYGKGMKKRPKKEGKIKRSKNRPKGLRLRKTARGKVISQDIVQINLKTLKEGNKKLSKIFPEQNKKGESTLGKPPGEPAGVGEQAGEQVGQVLGQENSEPKGEENAQKEEQKPVEKPKIETPQQTTTSK